jgi:hypothetical protein
MDPTSSVWTVIPNQTIWADMNATTSWRAWVDGSGSQTIDVRMNSERVFGVNDMFTFVEPKKEASEWDS